MSVWDKAKKAVDNCWEGVCDALDPRKMGVKLTLLGLLSVGNAQEAGAQTVAGTMNVGKDGVTLTMDNSQQKTITIKSVQQKRDASAARRKAAASAPVKTDVQLKRDASAARRQAYAEASEQRKAAEEPYKVVKQVKNDIKQSKVQAKRDISHIRREVGSWRGS